MDDDGNLLDYEQFCTKHNLNPSFLDFICLRNTLPNEFIFLSKSYSAHQKNTSSSTLSFDTRNINFRQKMYQLLYS